MDVGDKLGTNVQDICVNDFSCCYIIKKRVNDAVII